MIEKSMRLKSLVINPVIYVIVGLYLFVPLWDSMMCPDCLGNAPFQGEMTHSNWQSPHGDAGCFSPDGAQSETSHDQDAKSFCSICANVLMGVAVVSPCPPAAIAHCNGSQVVTIPSELHYSINKPPQNFCV